VSDGEAAEPVTAIEIREIAAWHDVCLVVGCLATTGTGRPGKPGTAGKVLTKVTEMTQIRPFPGLIIYLTSS
jgi:hypothetical protein